MLNTRIVALAAPFVLATLAQGQTLQNEKFVLDNGLTVILHPDHTLPRVGINIWYRVGARNEPPGRSGFAHLFEHLMFMGTKRVPGNDFDVLMETGGGSNNASTSLDRTNYHSSGPASLLPTLLWLDADRLEDMGLTMNQDKLNKQRDVVRNELRQTVENAPYGRAYEATYQMLYPVGHPYHNGVIGTHEDLESAKVDDVKNFFATFYQPNNASLVVAGDFDPAAIKPLIRDLFGTLPKGNVAPQVKVPMPRLDRILRSTSFDKVQLPAVAYAFHSPAQFQAGDGEMDIIASVLGEGQNSRLYQRLVVKEKLAAEVSASQDSAFLSSVFRVNVMAKPDADLAKVEKITDEEITRLINEGPTQAELDQRKTSFELGKLSSLQSIEARADAMNQYEYVWGTPDGLERDLNRYRQATIESVKKWAKDILTLDARVVQYVLPEEPGEGGRAKTARESRPTDFSASAFTPMQPETITLGNGVKALVFSKPGLPLVDVGILFSPGSAGVLDSAAKAGRATLMAHMLSEGTGDMDGEAFAAAMQSLGASFGSGANHESFTVHVSGLKKNIDRALDLASKAMISPRMNADDWARVKGLQMDNLKQADDEPRAVAPKVAGMMLFGVTNAYGMPTGGTVATVDALTLEDIKSAHQAIVYPGNATIVVAGDLSAAEARAMLEKRFGADWTAGPHDVTWTTAQPPKPESMRVYIVDRPHAVQTMIHLRAPGVKFADAGRVQRQLLNTILGGSFTSRLNQNLRENHGYTYGARTGFDMEPSVGVFLASSSVVADKTGPALKEFMGELTKIRTGDVTDAEAAKARTTTFDNAVEPFGTLGGIVGAAETRLESKLPWTTFGDDLNAMRGVDAKALNALAPGAIDLDHSVLVLVGDKGLILEQIKDLGLPNPIEVTADGKAK
jgi:zinc protease